MRKRALLALLLAVVFLFTACSANKNNPNEKQPTKEESCTIGMSFDSFVI